MNDKQYELRQERHELEQDFYVGDREYISSNSTLMTNILLNRILKKLDAVQEIGESANVTEKQISKAKNILDAFQEKQE